MRCVPGQDTCTGSWNGYSTNVASLAVMGEMAVDYNVYETLDGMTLSYTIPSLVPGTTYYVAVSARNTFGIGSRVASSPSSITPIIQVPQPPRNVALQVNPGVATQLRMKWEPSSSDGGSVVQMYRIELDASPQFLNRLSQDVWCPSSPIYAVWQVMFLEVPLAMDTFVFN